MNKTIRFSVFGLVVLITAVCGSQIIADVPDKVVNDATAADYAKNYKVVAVRNAIAKCRQGKYEEAVPVLETYAKANDVGATYILAKLCLEGLGVPKSRERTLELLTKNVEDGHAPSMVQLGQLKEDDTPAEALQLYKMASAAGDMNAHVKLGLIMETGKLGARPNPKLAFKYFEKSFKANSPIGMYHVARCYDSGLGVSPNAIEATRLFRSAAMFGIPRANTLMAQRYFEGKGVEPDPVAAVGWLLRGAQAGSTEAMVLLGQRYENGDVIAQDFNRAGQLYSDAAKLNDPTGRYLLARMYLRGTGTKADPVRAYVLLEGAQSLPRAKALFEKLSNELSPSQLTLAQQKIADAKANEAKEAEANEAEANQPEK